MCSVGGFSLRPESWAPQRTESHLLCLKASARLVVPDVLKHRQAPSRREGAEHRRAPEPGSVAKVSTADRPSRSASQESLSSFWFSPPPPPPPFFFFSRRPRSWGPVGFRRESNPGSLRGGRFVQQRCGSMVFLASLREILSATKGWSGRWEEDEAIAEWWLVQECVGQESISTLLVAAARRQPCAIGGRCHPGRRSLSAEVE